MIEQDPKPRPSGETDHCFAEFDQLQQEIARRIKDNQRFLERFLDEDFDEDEDTEEAQEDEDFEEL